MNETTILPPGGPAEPPHAPQPTQVTSPNQVTVPSLLDQRRAEYESRRLRRHHLRKSLALQSIRDHASARVVTRHLGAMHPQQAQEFHQLLTRKMMADVEAGATIHRRLPLVLRLLPLGVALLDAAVLYLFCADVLNAKIGVYDAKWFGAVALATLGTGVTYAWLSITGIRLRDYRNPLGAIEWRILDAGTRVMLVVALISTAAMALLTFSRVEQRAAEAAGAGYLAPEQIVMLAAIFGVFSACANLSVLAVHALDGSAHGVHARDLSRVLRAHHGGLRRRQRLLGRRLLAEARSTPSAALPPLPMRQVLDVEVHLTVDPLDLSSPDPAGTGGGSGGGTGLTAAPRGSSPATVIESELA